MQYLVLLAVVLAMQSISFSQEIPDSLQKENLIAWCILPFDSQERGPVERTAMLNRLGIQRVAYDWREKHVPTFEEEIQQYQKHGIQFFAFWGKHPQAFELFRQYDLHPQIWQTLPSPAGDSQAEKVRRATEQLLPLAREAAQIKCQLGLYNHGGWGGEPENLVAVCESLRNDHKQTHVGIVYNLHHAHSRMDDFPKTLELMKPYLLCLNINGMDRNGDQQGKKILPLGAGELDQQWFQALLNSSYKGPIGILGHTQDDVELRLQDNLTGLKWLKTNLKKQSPRPKYRTWAKE